MLDRVRTDDNRFRQTFVERLGALEQIRSQIYLSGTYVRDYLLSPDSALAEQAGTQRARLSGIEAETRALLGRYAASLDPDEREAFQALRTEIDDYWHALQSTFDWTSSSATGSASPSSMSNWCPAAPLCCRLRTPSNPSTSAG